MADPKDKGPTGTAPNRPLADDSRANANWNDDDEGEEWRHPPVAPVDQGPLDSLGKAVSEIVTGADAEKSKKSKP